MRRGDNFCIPARYPNSHPTGAPFEHYGPLQSEEAIRYARGDWGVGSDLDVIIIVESSQQPFERRGSAWDLSEFPVPVDVLVYTEKEWQSLVQRGCFAGTVLNEAVWVLVRQESN